jgi:hypothetical protein
MNGCGLALLPLAPIPANPFEGLAEPAPDTPEPF